MISNWVIVLLVELCLLSIDGVPIENSKSGHAILIKKEPKNSTEDGSVSGNDPTENNKRAEVCDDFYNAVCGNWLNRASLEDFKHTSDHYTGLGEEINHRLKEMLELRTDFNYTYYERYTNPDLPYPEAFRSAKNIYRSCMKQNLPDATPQEWFLQVIKSIGPWPMVDDREWEDLQFDLTSMLNSVLSLNGNSAFIEIDVYATEEDPDLKRIRITSAYNELAFGKKSIGIYKNSEDEDNAQKIQSYSKYLVQLVTNLKEDLGLEVDEETIEDEVQEVIKLERVMADLDSIIGGLSAHNSYKHPRLHDLNKLMPVVEWERLMLTIVPTSLHPYIRNNPFIFIGGLDWLSEYSALISRSSPRVIANFIMIHYVKQRVHQLGPKYAELSEIFKVPDVNLDDAEDDDEDPDKWMRCLKKTNDFMHFAVAAMYGRENHPQESIDAVHKIYTDIKSAWSDMLTESKFLDDEDRQETLKKLQYIKENIGYPEWIWNDERIDDYYNGAKIDSSMNFLQVEDTLWRWKFQKNLEEVIRTRDRSIFDVKSLDVNAYYDPSLNSITILAGIMGAPFFYNHEETPAGYNYGAIGQTIGHEVGHAFDKDGFTFDHVGRKRSEFGNGTAKALTKKYQCLITQYEDVKIADSVYEVEGAKINGTATLGENIADLDGLKASFRAYKKYLNRTGGVDKKLYNFTQEQVFFLGYARQECAANRLSTLLWQIDGDVHAPSFARVNVVLQNMPEFAEAWKCKSGTRMNPVQRCSMWGREPKVANANPPKSENKPVAPANTVKPITTAPKM